MRTVTFKSVFEGVLRRHGMDPRGDAVSSDAGLSLVEHINARVQRAWFAWEWPDWMITEERAYRQIWNSSRQFYLAGQDGNPDEVFYIPNVDTQSLTDAGYYRVLRGAPDNPPVGTEPTDTAYWEKMDSVDAYIAYDQVCRRRIGEFLDVYGNNPAVIKPPRVMGHRVNQNGAQVYEGAGLLTVFVRYLTPPEKFTTFPYIDSRTYLRGDVVYVPAEGECYQALQVTTDNDPVTTTGYWRQCLFPEVLAQYVKAGAFADSLRESDTSDERDPVMLQIRGQQSAAADGEAEDELTRQIQRLQAQGQHYSYLPFGVTVRRTMGGGNVPGVFWSTPAYVLQGAASSNYGPLMPTGEGTTTISDQCETEWGYIPPAPPAVIVRVPIANQRGSVQLVMGQNYADVVFHSSQVNANWILVECEVVNTTDATPLNIAPGIITSRTLTGFRIQLEGLPDTSNYFLRWAINGNIVPPAPATTYALSGPASGAIGAATTFTVALLPDTTVADQVTITPSDGGAGGTFSPTSVELTTDDPEAAFTYTPGLYGSKTIGTTNDGELTDPAPVIFNVLTTTYTLSGPSSGPPGVASSNFTVALPAGGAVTGTVTVTPHDGGAGGTFIPATIALTTGTPSATFTYTLPSSATATISVTNNGGLTNPGNLLYSTVFDPTTIAGLKVWLKADSLALSDGAAISTWPDSSGNGNNATQTGTARPIFKTNIVNGKPVVRFDGVDDFLALGTAISLAAGGECCVLVVHQTSGDCCLIGSMTGGRNDQHLRAGQSGANTLSYSNPIDTPSVSTTLTVPRTSWNTAVGRRITNFIQFFDSTGYQGGGAATVAQEIKSIGALASLSALYVTKDIAEVLIYDSSLSSGDFNAVHNYLGAKYGITIAMRFRFGPEQQSEA